MAAIRLMAFGWTAAVLMGGLESVVRAFWVLMLGQDFGKMVVRGARQG